VARQNSKQQVCVVGLKERVVSNAEELLGLIGAALPSCQLTLARWELTLARVSRIRSSRQGQRVEEHVGYRRAR
jgi:hypothetical protein